MGVHLTGMYFIGIYGRACHRRVFLPGRTVDNFTNDLCAKLGSHANSPSPEIALEFAPPIHPGRGGSLMKASSAVDQHTWCATIGGERVMFRARIYWAQRDQ
jgi:hypothetical protein